MPTYIDVITDALTILKVARAGDVVDPETMDLGQRTLNRILDAWGANDRAAYVDSFTDYTLTPSLSPHTIGPTGTFVTTVRPVRVDYAKLSLGGSPAVYIDIDVRDDRWYREQAVPALSTSVPTDVYYEPGWPNGSLYFFPVPSTARTVRLWMTGALAAVTDFTTTFTLPPGYQDALTKTLAVELAEPCGQTASAWLVKAEQAARDLIFGNNDEIPDLCTRDAGMPGGNGGGYNFYTGQVE